MATETVANNHADLYSIFAPRIGRTVRLTLCSEDESALDVPYEGVIRNVYPNSLLINTDITKPRNFTRISYDYITSVNFINK